MNDMMDEYNYDYELEKRYHPENFGEEVQDEARSREWEGEES